SSAASSVASPLRASPGHSPPSSMRECGFPGGRRRFALHQRVQDEPGHGLVRGLPAHARRDRRLVGDERGGEVRGARATAKERRAALKLPRGIQILERGWLSSNNVVLLEKGAAVV